jgi:bifunctional lysine-specific demethylase and histidyl-hydroxylase NO66
LSSSTSSYFLADKKNKSGKRIHIVAQQQQNVKKQKVLQKVEFVKNQNGSSTSTHKAESAEKKSAGSKGNSIEDGKKMFEWLITGIEVDEFFSKHWEKKPKLIKRNESRDFYGSLLSTEAINTMLKENYLEYTKNIDITSYRDGVRETHNPEGRAVNIFF